MIIALSGYARSGKDTAAEIISKLYGYDIKKFSGKLKEVASILTGIPADRFEDQDFKDRELSADWIYRRMALVGVDHDGRECYGTELERMTVRGFLQRLGTDAIRDNLHPNTWVNALMAEYRPPKMSEYYPSKWVITDCRFPNEAAAAKDRGGFVVRVVRDGVNPTNLHSSETALDEYLFDYTIYNNGTITQLGESIKKMFDDLGIKTT